VLGWLNIAFACLGVCLVILLFSGALAMPVFLKGILPTVSPIY
jgi:energy-converting hydrogenase Eha subunit E